jgi:hypothetical protein
MKKDPDYNSTDSAVVGELSARWILLANSLNKELMHFAQLNLKDLRS